MNDHSCSRRTRHRYKFKHKTAQANEITFDMLICGFDSVCGPFEINQVT